MAGLSVGSFFFLLLGIIAIGEAVPMSEPVPLVVKVPAGVPVPIMYETPDYQGPYDPVGDPLGVRAAANRQMLIGGKQLADLTNSYIPPGAFTMLKTELGRVLLEESKRFAVAHPIESAELAGIAAKVVGLVNTAAKKVQAEAKKGVH